MDKLIELKESNYFAESYKNYFSYDLIHDGKILQVTTPVYDNKNNPIAVFVSEYKDSFLVSDGFLTHRVLRNYKTVGKPTKLHQDFLAKREIEWEVDKTHGIHLFFVCSKEQLPLAVMFFAQTISLMSETFEYSQYAKFLRS